MKLSMKIAVALCCVLFLGTACFAEEAAAAPVKAAAAPVKAAADNSEVVGLLNALSDRSDSLEKEMAKMQTMLEKLSNSVNTLSTTVKQQQVQQQELTQKQQQQQQQQQQASAASSSDAAMLQKLAESQQQILNRLDQGMIGSLTSLKNDAMVYFDKACAYISANAPECTNEFTKDFPKHFETAKARATDEFAKGKTLSKEYFAIASAVTVAKIQELAAKLEEISGQKAEHCHYAAVSFGVLVGTIAFLITFLIVKAVLRVTFYLLCCCPKDDKAKRKKRAKKIKKARASKSDKSSRKD